MLRASLRSCVFLCLTVGWAGAAAESEIERFFRELNGLSASFTQTVMDENGQVEQVSHGQMAMQKPGRFRWDYHDPYRQLIVADGERLWLYDKDLEQVTVQRIDEALTETPLALLSGVAPIEEKFEVRQSHDLGTVRWYELQPKSGDSEFKLLKVAFDQGRLVSFELENALKQVTRLSLQNVRVNPDLDPQRFQFTPPPGVDVVGDDFANGG